VPEDRPDVVGALIARPALENPELARVMDSDVQRCVSALGEPDQRARGAGRNCAVPRVDRPHDVTSDERLPRLVLADAVGPFLVGERARRAEWHDEDERAHTPQRDELVLDDAHARGGQERTGPPREAVQEVGDRVATVRVRPIAGREVHIDGLPAPAEGGACDREAHR